MHPARPTTCRVTIAGGPHGVAVTGFDNSTDCDRPFPDQPTWSELLASIVNDPSGLAGYELLKYSGENEVFRATLTWKAGQAPASYEVVCKKTARQRGLRGLLDSLRAPRARKNFDRGFLLRSLGIATPLPLAMITHSQARADWLVTEYIPDLVDLDRIALVDLPRLQSRRLRKNKDALIAATGELFARLYRNNLYHRDLKASNILIAGWQSPGKTLRTTLVDLDGLERGVRGATRRWKPLLRLAASLLDNPSLTRSDFARLLRTYLSDTEGNPSAWRGHFLRLLPAATRYADQSRRRKTHKLDGYA